MNTSAFVHKHRSLIAALAATSIVLVAYLAYQNWINSHPLQASDDVFVENYRDYSIYSYTTAQGVTMYYGRTTDALVTPSHTSMEALKAWIDAAPSAT